MTREQQRLLKQVLGRPVPKEYLDLLRRFPTELAGKLAAHHPHPDERLLFTDMATVIAQNQEVRLEDIWTEEGPWPPGHLCIGVDIGGDRWSLCAADRQVYRLLHESGSLEEQAPNLQSWLGAVEQHLGGDDRAFETVKPSRPPAEAPPLPKPQGRAQANIHKYLRGWVESHDKAIAKSPKESRGRQERAELLGPLLVAEMGNSDHDDYFGAYRLLFDSIEALGEVAVAAHQDWLEVAPRGTSEHRRAKAELGYVETAYANWQAGKVVDRRSFLSERYQETKDDYFLRELDKLG